MKPHLVLAAAVAFTFAARADFVVESKIESPQFNSAVTTKIKDGKMRSDMPTGPMGAMSSIVDSASGESVTLIHGMKSAMKTNANQMKQTLEALTKGLNPGAPAVAPAKPKATGQKETVNDLECEIYEWNNGGMTSRYWIALKHPQAAALKSIEKKMMGSLLSALNSQAPDLSTLPGPQIKSETNIAGMKITATILSIKEAPVEAKEFEVPTDYQTMAMPTLPAAGAGLPGAPGGK
jgi:hypothetical protein